MLFKNLRKLQEVQEEENDIVYEEVIEDDYEREEIKGAISELTDAVAAMKGLVLSVMENEPNSVDEDQEAIRKVTEIYSSHLKINWDDARTGDILPTLKTFESVQNHLKEINYHFVHLEISEYRYELLRNILVSKLTFLLRRILNKAY